MEYLNILVRGNVMKIRYRMKLTIKSRSVAHTELIQMCNFFPSMKVQMKIT